MDNDGSALALFKTDGHRKIFLVKRSDYHVWNLPGGGIEAGESPEAAAVREAGEETGFKVKLIKKIGVYEITENNQLKRKTYLFEGRVVSGEFRPEYPGCKGGWFRIDHLPFDMTKATKLKIEDAENYVGAMPFVKRRQEEKISDNLGLVLIHPLTGLKVILRKYLRS